MRLLDRYVLQNFVVPFLYCTFGFLAIWLVFDLSEVTASSSYARGNENNAYKADGVYYLGPGILPGYGITSFMAHYDLTKHLQLRVQVDNLFDKHYYTVGQLAHTGLSAQGGVNTRPFPAYGAGPESGNGRVLTPPCALSPVCASCPTV